MRHKILISDRDLTPLEEIQNIAKDVTWEFTRIGGCGAFSFQVPTKYCRDLTLGLGFNVKIYRWNPSTKVYDIWYQGRIENKNYSIRGEDETISISGMGYQSALKDIRVNRTYSSAEISTIVTSVLDNDVVGNTDVTYAGGDIEATSFTPNSLEFNYTDALSVMQTLADLVGTREWGVNAEREFYFKARSSTAGFKYFLGNKITNLNFDNTSTEIANRIIVIGGDVAGTPFTEVFNNSDSQLKWKRRDVVIQNSSVVTSQVASQLATARFTEFADVTRRARLDLLEERQIEETIPIPLFQVIPELARYGERLYGTFLYSGIIDFQVNRIQYKLDDTGNLTISMQVGQLRPSISEDIGQLEYKIEQLTSQGI